MRIGNESIIRRLVESYLGVPAAQRVLQALSIRPALLAQHGDTVSRAAFAMALNVVLFDDLLDRVPSSAAYVEASLARGSKVCFDHGALRTVRFADGSTGALPPGQNAFARILGPLGYEVADTYPLPALRMTGRAWRHRDIPDEIPQFFVSELHVERFDDHFEPIAQRVFGTSIDPIDGPANAVLSEFLVHGEVPFEAAAKALPTIALAFERQHNAPSFDDYRSLLEYSAEAAWIATEGNAFNHATDRVADVDALAIALKAEGYPMKERVEVSSNGRVRQTALRADFVERTFSDGIKRVVPGSFYEFISRELDPLTGCLDLGFDSGNATAIFAMTKAA